MADDEGAELDVIELNEEDFIEDELDVDDDDEIADDTTTPDNEGAEAVPDDSDFVFDKHTGSVFCCDLLGNSLVAVSGGEDDRAYVWNTSSGENLLECRDHSDSVTSVCFNHDGTLLATGDMSGVIHVWKLATKTKIKSFSTTDLAWLRWHPNSNVLLGGTVEGSVWMWHISSEGCKIMSGHGSSSECSKILPDGVRMAVGYGDGSVYIWDLKSASTLHKITNEVAHRESVTCVESYSDNVILTGSVDGTAKLINSNNGKVLGTLDCAISRRENEEQIISVECVGFCHTLPVCATGSLDGNLAIWDIATQGRRQICNHESGVIRLVWDHESPLIYTAAMDGIVRLWDSRSGSSVTQWSGHTGEILDMVLSKDGNTIITASDDKTCRIFHVNRPDR